MDAGEVVQVTQADRVAASDAFYTLPKSHWPFAMWMAEMENGDHDDAPMVQAFAHHRLAQCAADRKALDAARGEIERLRAALQTAVDAIHLYLLPSAMDGGIGECTAILNAKHADAEARVALALSARAGEGEA